MRAPLAFARTFWDKSFARTRPVLSWVKSKQLLPANAKCDNWIQNYSILHSIWVPSSRIDMPWFGPAQVASVTSIPSGKIVPFKISITFRLFRFLRLYILINWAGKYLQKLKTTQQQHNKTTTTKTINSNNTDHFHLVLRRNAIMLVDTLAEQRWRGVLISKV